VSFDVTAPAAELDPEALTDLVERVINGVELPDYAGLHKSSTALGDGRGKGLPRRNR
jgi:hypothetical protein